MTGKIAGAPTLWHGLGFYYSAFLSLSSCRIIGMSEGRIPWTAAREFAKQHELQEDEFEDLWALLSMMDGAYLEFRKKQADTHRQSLATKNQQAGTVKPKVRSAIGKGR